jgi:hypothetical protein
MWFENRIGISEYIGVRSLIIPVWRPDFSINVEIYSSVSIQFSSSTRITKQLREKIWSDFEKMVVNLRSHMYNKIIFIVKEELGF